MIETKEENKSSFHLHVRNILKTSSLFNIYKIFEEYPVWKINSSFMNRRCFYDFVILSIMVVIEVHGQQHYRPQVRSKEILAEEAIAAFERRRCLDALKKRAAEEAGFTYVSICYADIEQGVVDSSWLLSEIERKRNG